MSQDTRALPLGRILRFLLGAYLATVLWPFFRDAAPERIRGAILAVVGLALCYAALHFLVAARSGKLDPWLGGCVAILPLALVFVLGGSTGRVGALAFLALSLVLAAVRADAGCEVMSLPALVTGRRTHIACLLFSPLDRVEAKIVARGRSARTQS